MSADLGPVVITIPGAVAIFLFGILQLHLAEAQLSSLHFNNSDPRVPDILSYVSVKIHYEKSQRHAGLNVLGVFTGNECISNLLHIMGNSSIMHG